MRVLFINIERKMFVHHCEGMYLSVLRGGQRERKRERGGGGAVKDN